MHGNVDAEIKTQFDDSLSNLTKIAREKLWVSAENVPEGKFIDPNLVDTLCDENSARWKIYEDGLSELAEEPNEKVIAAGYSFSHEKKAIVATAKHIRELADLYNFYY
ncbi:MAG: hypothetical protein ABI778_07980 [Ignavibacteriota bacterium]